MAVSFPERLSIGWIKKMYREGLLYPSEVIDEIIRRVEKTEDYNIWIVKPSRELIEPYLVNLCNLDRSLPLYGIPFAIKDNIDLEGIPTTSACPAYQYVPEESATVVRKLIEAGAIPVGKTNLDQFATGLVGTRSPYGECHNSLDPEMISGGSSSGSAVSVSLGMAAFSLGTDTAGSGRVPAMLNNLIGLKPPVGSWSTKGLVPACASLDCITVFASSLEDAQIVDQVSRGFDEECAWSRKIEKRPEKLPEKVYIPSCELQFFGRWSDDYRAKWERSIRKIEQICEKKGIKIERTDTTIFNDAALILYDGAYVAERWEDLKDFVESNPGETFPVTETILRSGAKAEQTAAKLFGNLHELQAYKHKAHIILENAVLIMPTAGGSYTRDEVRKDPIRTNSNMGLYTNHCNLLDLTALAIPEDTTDRIRPFGITVFGRFDCEDLVGGFAKAFMDEETVPLAVCGLHKQGYRLQYQLDELGARYIGCSMTSKKYRLYKLNGNPTKPGLVKVSKGGQNIEVELYEVPIVNLGRFMLQVKEPLAIGDVELMDQRIVKGFLCQSYASEGAPDISAIGFH